MGEEEVRLMKSSALSEAQLREMLSWWELHGARLRREERDREDERRRERSRLLREDERRRERFRLLAVMAGTAVVTSLTIALVTVISFAPRRAPEVAAVVAPAPTMTTVVPPPPAMATVERTQPRASVANVVEAPTVAVPAAAVAPGRADIPTPPKMRAASALAAAKAPESQSPAATSSESSALAAALTPSELAAAQRRVERLLQEATTPERKAELQGKQTVAETWIQAIGYDGARVKARSMARAFMAVVNAAEAEKGSRSPEFVQATALVKYWRDISDLIIVATPTSRS